MPPPPQPPPDRPSFHLAPRSGWVNDPNGPLFYKGYYHLFYQFVPDSCVWAFGLQWGHACSRDLVHWEHLPPALSPTAGSLDQDGCFSGCATVAPDGTPVILYTGVRLRSSPTCGPLPPAEYDLQLPFIESQCSAVPADPDDPKLTYWVKSEVPWLSLPPPNMNLGGWRDPYIIGKPHEPGQDGRWSLIIGSGIKYEGGVVLVYTSKNLEHGWEYWGELCEGRGKSDATGIVWECPLLAAPPAVPKQVHQGSEDVDGLSETQPAAKPGPGNGDVQGFERSACSSCSPAPPSSSSLPSPAEPSPHFFCMSPDAPTNPSYYWLGAYDCAARRFDLEGAAGPFRLDLGDILYAPNTLEDELHGRLLLWGWLQEKRKVGVYDYAGCMSTPRMMWLEHIDQAPQPLPCGAPTMPSASEQPQRGSQLALEEGGSATTAAAAAPAKSSLYHGWHLHQQPIPEISRLRNPWASWRLAEEEPSGEGLVLPGGGRFAIPRIGGPFLDIELVLQPKAEGALLSSAEQAGVDVGAEPVLRSSAERPASASGILLHSWQSGADGSAALLYHWSSGVLEVVFEAMDPETLAFSLAAPGARRVGGKLLRPPPPGSPLSLRIFLDYSVLEVFTGGGEVLTTRVYRGAAEGGCGVELISVDGLTHVLSAEAHEVRPMAPPGLDASAEQAHVVVPDLSHPQRQVVPAAANAASPFKALLPSLDFEDSVPLQAPDGNLPAGVSLDLPALSGSDNSSAVGTELELGDADAMVPRRQLLLDQLVKPQQQPQRLPVLTV